MRTRLVPALRSAPAASSAACARRSAVAAIFRIDPSTGDELVLFIKRVANPRDPWSGNIAMPGGGAEPADGADDERTAMREANEEVGIDLADARWEPLGRLADDKLIYSRGRPLSVSVFGFAWRERSAPAPAPRAQPGEVDAAWWVPTELLRPASLRWWSHPIGELSPWVRGRGFTARALRACLRAGGCEHVRVAAVALPPPPASAQPADAFMLWGLTLGFVSDVLGRAGRPRLTGPGAARAEFETPIYPARDAEGAPAGRLAAAALRSVFYARKARVAGRGSAAEIGGAALVCAAVALGVGRMLAAAPRGP